MSILIDAALSIHSPAYAAARERWRVMVGLDCPSTASTRSDQIPSPSGDVTDVPASVASPLRVTLAR